MEKTQRLFIKIQSPDQTYFEGEAEAITSLNSRGTFDILPLHENFISLINQTIVIYQNKKPIKEIHIDSGVLKVVDNRVEIFLGINTLATLTAPQSNS